MLETDGYFMAEPDEQVPEARLQDVKVPFNAPVEQKALAFFGWFPSELLFNGLKGYAVNPPVSR